jgi:hypothetical protein
MESPDRTEPRRPAADREIELRVAMHADGRQIVVRRFTEVDERSGRRTLHIDAVVR